MKNTFYYILKKTLAVYLCLVIVLSHTVTVFAAEMSSADSAALSRTILASAKTTLAPLANLLPAKAKSKIRIDKIKKGNFQAVENVALTVTNPDKEQLAPDLRDSEGKHVDTIIDQATAESTTALTIHPPVQFRPGKFTLTLKDKQGESFKQDFTWGVLAINTDQSIYTPQQKAAISMGVLDDKGNMVCNAQVTLEISSTGASQSAMLSTTDGGITVNPECQSHDFTLKPDYEASYTFGNVGTYLLKLTAVTPNGTRTQQQTIEVKNEVPFKVVRSSATRIYPPNDYPVTMNITANQDFNGTITETVPESFTITPADNPDSSYDSMKTLYLKAQKNPEIALEKKVLGTSTSSLLLPFSGAYKITEGFGAKLTDSSLRNFYAQYGLAGHDGVDFGLPLGTPLFSVDDGNVVWAGPGDYGNTVIIQHTWGKSYYGHLSIVKTSVGAHITKGAQIGYSGNSGESTGPHLHFAIKPNNPDMNNGYYGKIDPLSYFNIPVDAATADDSLTTTLSESVLGASTSAEPSQTASAEATITPSPTLKPLQTLTNQIQSPILRSQDKVKILSWDVHVKKGDKFTLSYTYKAPQISPQFYTLGPLRFSEQNMAKQVFKEARTWQIASDAVGTAWYNYNWTKRKQITIDSTKVGKVAFDAQAVKTDDAGTVLTDNFSLTTGTNSNRLIIVAVNNDGAANNTQSVTYNGVSLTKLTATQVRQGTIGDASLWYLVAPASGSHSVVVNFVALAHANMYAATFSGVDQTNPFGTIPTPTFNTSGSTTPSITATTRANQLVVDAMWTNTLGATRNVTAGQTKIWTSGTNGNGSYKYATTTSTTMSWSITSDPWEQAAVPINPDPQTNYPVEVSLASDAGLAASATSTGQTAGNDILFTDSTGQTKLSHEIENFTSATGALTAWVKIPSLSATSNTVIYMYYGNPSAASQQAATSVWDSNYKGVWHMKEDPGTAGFNTITKDLSNFTSVTGSTGAFMTFNQTVSSGCTNPVLLVGTSSDSAGNTNSSVTYAGQPLTLLATKNGGASTTEIWYIKNPMQGSSQQIKVNFPVGIRDQVAGSVSFCNVSTFTAIDPTLGTTSPITVGVTPTNTSQMIFAVAAGNGTGAAFTPNGTSLWNDNTAAGGFAQYKQSTGTTQTMSWTFTCGCSTQWSEIGVALNPTTLGNSINDSTTNANNGSAYSNTSITGQVYNGLGFNGTSGYVTVPDNSTLDPGSNSFTASFWMKTTDVTTTQGLFHHINSSTPYDGWMLALVDSGGTCGAGKFCVSDGTNSVGVSESLVNNTWYYVTLTKSGTTASIYVNGALQGTATLLSTIGNSYGSVYFGKENTDTNSYFTGNMDEVRYSDSIVRSVSWINTEYNNQNSPSTFYALGTQEETNASAPTNNLLMRHGKWLCISSVCAVSPGKQPFVF